MPWVRAASRSTDPPSHRSSPITQIVPVEGPAGNQVRQRGSGVLNSVRPIVNVADAQRRSASGEGPGPGGSVPQARIASIVFLRGPALRSRRPPPGAPFHATPSPRARGGRSIDSLVARRQRALECRAMQVDVHSVFPRQREGLETTDRLANANIVLIAADRPERILFGRSGSDLWQATLAPNARWVSFVAHAPDRPGGLELIVAPAGGSPPERWTRVAADHIWPDKPRWAPDGRTLYFISRRPSSYFNLWGVRFDPRAGKAVRSAVRPHRVRLAEHVHLTAARHRGDGHLVAACGTHDQERQREHLDARQRGQVRAGRPRQIHQALSRTPRVSLRSSPRQAFRGLPLAGR